MQETWVRSLGQEDHLEKEIATHSSILAWKIPWKRSLVGYRVAKSQTRLSSWAQQHSMQLMKHRKDRQDSWHSAGNWRWWGWWWSSGIWGEKSVNSEFSGKQLELELGTLAPISHYPLLPHLCTFFMTQSPCPTAPIFTSPFPVLRGPNNYNHWGRTTTNCVQIMFMILRCSSRLRFAIDESRSQRELTWP